VLGLDDGRGVKEEGGVVPEVDDDAVSLSRRDDAEEPEPGIGWSAEGVPVINTKYNGIYYLLAGTESNCPIFTNNIKLGTSQMSVGFHFYI
jgi:hypothetical protein